jgi:glycosyltransferase involved in cell wall biosynthesis
LQGTGHYARMLLGALARLDPPFQFLLLYDGSSQLPDLPGELPGRLIPIRRGAIDEQTKGLWNHASYPLDLLRCQADALHVLAPEHAAWFTSVPQIATVHDLCVFIDPDRLRTGIRYGIQYKCVARASQILAVSDATRLDFLARYPAALKKTRTVYHGMDPSFRDAVSVSAFAAIRRRYSLFGPYVLYLGDLRDEGHNRRKNLGTLLEAFASSPTVRRESWTLVLAGKRGHQADRLLEQARTLGCADRLILTDYVPDSDLPALFANAEAFVYPSKREGFGLPVLMALAAGTPVLASKSSSIPEVCGEAALLVNTEDVETLREGLDTLAGDPTLRQTLAAAGRVRSRRFTWEQTAIGTVEAYQRALTPELS